MRWQPIGNIQDGPRIVEDEAEATDAPSMSYDRDVAPIDASSYITTYNPWWLQGCPQT